VKTFDTIEQLRTALVELHALTKPGSSRAYGYNASKDQSDPDKWATRGRPEGGDRLTLGQLSKRSRVSQNRTAVQICSIR